MIVNKNRDKNGMDESGNYFDIARHDKKYHPNGFSPESQSCKFREKIKEIERLDAIDFEIRSRAGAKRIGKKSKKKLRPQMSSTSQEKVAEAGIENPRTANAIASKAYKNKCLKIPPRWENKKIGYDTINLLKSLPLSTKEVFLISIDIKDGRNTPAMVLRNAEIKIASNAIDAAESNKLITAIHENAPKLYDKDPVIGKKKFIAALIPSEIDEDDNSSISSIIRESSLREEYVNAIYDEISEIHKTPNDSTDSAFCELSSHNIYLSPKSHGWGYGAATFFHECGHAIFDSTAKSSTWTGENEFDVQTLDEILNLANQDGRQMIEGSTYFKKYVGQYSGSGLIKEHFFGKCSGHVSLDVSSTIDDIMAAAGIHGFKGHGESYFGKPPPKTYEEKDYRCHEIVANIISALMMNTDSHNIVLDNFPRLTKWVNENVFKIKDTETEIL